MQIRASHFSTGVFGGETAVQIKHQVQYKTFFTQKKIIPTIHQSVNNPLIH